MKKLLVVLIATVALSAGATEMQKVVVGEHGNLAQDCRGITIHKKLEGTKVPEKK